MKKLLGFVAVVTTGVCLAQEVPPQPTLDSTGTYKLTANARAVVLDVTVTDLNGKPYAGLTRSQIHVFEDDAPQTLRLFEVPAEHNLPGTVKDQTGKELVRQSGEAPLTILLLDHISTEPEDMAQARDSLINYLAKQPGQLPSPTQVMLLTSESLKPLTPFTLDRNQAMAAVKNDNEPSSWYVMRDRIPGYKATGLGTSTERLAIYAGALSELALSLKPYSTRKNIVWIGPGLPALNQILAISLDNQKIIREALEPLITRMVDARMSLTTIDPQGVTVAPTQLASVSGSNGSGIATSGGDPATGELAFEQIAVQTGGRIYRMRNDIGTEVGSAVNSSASYYTLSYDPTDKNYNGKLRRIKVTVDVPNLIVQAQRGYLALPPQTNTPNTVAEELAFAISSNLQFPSIDTKARLMRMGDSAQVHIIVDSSTLKWDAVDDSEKRTATVNLVAATENKDGKVLHYVFATQHAKATETATRGTHAEFVLPMPNPSKATVLRVVVRDQGTGRLGSAEVPLYTERK